MCRMILLVVCLIYNAGVQAQTFDEWFKQKKTQTKYSVQQIAALQVYINYLKKGYEIARGGLSLIERVRNGEFGLHDVFYTSLSLVSPKLRNYPCVLSVLKNLVTTQEQCRHLFQLARSPALDANTVSTIHTATSRLLADCEQSVTDLTTILSDKELQLSDDERIRRIDLLCNRSEKLAVFSRQLTTDVAILDLHRQSENVELERLRNYYK